MKRKRDRCLVPAVVADMYTRRMMSLERISRETGMCPPTVRRCLGRAGFPIRSRPKQGDISGRKYGKLTVATRVCDDEKGEECWLCDCECGERVSRRRQDLLRGQCKSCRKCILGRKRWGPLTQAVWTIITKCADLRDIPVRITPDYAGELLAVQGERCALTGWPITCEGGARRRTASLDRIDSSGVYEAGNVQWVDKRLNRMKLDLSDDEFIKWCRLISRPLPTDGLPAPQPIPLTRYRPHHKICGGLKGETFRIVTGGAHKKWPVTVTPQYLWDLFVNQRGACAITGVPLALPGGAEDKRQRTASLDRIDSKRGYEPDNVHWVHVRVNMLKSSYPLQEVLAIAAAVTAYRGKD